MKKVAEVFVNIPIKSIAKAYTYIVPEEFSYIGAGWRILVPFGNRQAEGFVVATAERESTAELKPILALVDAEPWFNDAMIALSYWMAAYYLCSPAEIMRLFMPGKSGSKITPVYVPNEEKMSDTNALSPEQKALLEWIRGNFTTASLSLYKEFPKSVVDKGIRQLIKQKFIFREYRVQKTAKEKMERYLILKRSLTETELEAFARKPAQKKLLALLQEHGALSAAQLKSMEVGAHVQQALLKEDFVQLSMKRILRDSYRDTAGKKQMLLRLTDEQEHALRPIRQSIEQECFSVFLLHGITGSGKTQVYIEAVQTARSQGKNAIVLVPEIALTGQMIRQFKTYFPDEVIVMHSRLSIGERNDAILRIRRGEASVVIGARSALFTPVDDLGVIVVDEEHDASYKQDEAPRYHTRDAAKQLAALHKAALILGSATPSVESFAAAQAKEYQLLSLQHRVGEVPLPSVQVVDMRAELRMRRKNIISPALKELIAETIQRGEQVILLLNRRGFSTFVMCRECGHVVSCKNCTLPLVYHKNGALQCHFCDTNEVVPDVCPKCDSRYIRYFGSGTERLETELQQLFPAARAVRMDRDTTGKKFAHAEILRDFSQKRYDILLGTQMVAKGHDIQNVTAVGIISADSSLNLPDFRAAERCFGLITQAAGRAGRGEVRGRVVVQTYNPKHYAVLCGARHDYHSFYQEEILLRKQLLYPPYSDLIKVMVQHIEAEQALATAENLVRTLKMQFPQTVHQFWGPVPSGVPRLREWYRYTVLIKSQEIAEVKDFMRESGLYLKKEFIIDVNPLNVL